MSSAVCSGPVTSAGLCSGSSAVAVDSEAVLQSQRDGVALAVLAFPSQQPGSRRTKPTSWPYWEHHSFPGESGASGGLRHRH